MTLVNRLPGLLRGVIGCAVRAADLVVRLSAEDQFALAEPARDPFRAEREVGQRVALVLGVGEVDDLDRLGGVVNRSAVAPGDDELGLVAVVDEAAGLAGEAGLAGVDALALAEEEALAELGVEGEPGAAVGDLALLEADGVVGGVEELEEDAVAEAGDLAVGDAVAGDLGAEAVFAGVREGLAVLEGQAVAGAAETYQLLFK